MVNNLTTLTEKNFKVGDKVVLYVFRGSDVDESLQRGIYEGIVANVIEGSKHREIDLRYLIRCGCDFRDTSCCGGVAPNEAPVSKHSPCLMTRAEYDKLRSDPKWLSKWIGEVTHILKGYEVPERLINWQSWTTWTLKKLNIPADDIIFEMIQDFAPKGGLKLVEIQ